MMEVREILTILELLLIMKNVGNWVRRRNIAAFIRHHLTNYIDLFKFLINPEKASINRAVEIKLNQQMHLFQM